MLGVYSETGSVLHHNTALKTTHMQT